MAGPVVNTGETKPAFYKHLAKLLRRAADKLDPQPTLPAFQSTWQPWTTGSPNQCQYEVDWTTSR